MGKVPAMGRKEDKEKRQPNPKKTLSTSVDVDAKLQQAISLYQIGQLQQAEQICQQILKDFPQHANAIHLLGVIAYQVDLFMGAPVVGLTDTSKLVHRSSSVILSPLGLGEWAAKTKDEYVEIVCNWVRNLGELAELRRELRDRVLTRAAKFAPQVEVGYREMWSRWCSGGKPSAIYIK